MNARLPSSPTESAPAWTQIQPDPKYWEAFSEREQQIYRSICEGETDKQIARTLSVTPHLVQWYLRRMYKATGARTRTELLVIVGRLSPPPAPPQKIAPQVPRI